MKLKWLFCLVLLFIYMESCNRQQTLCFSFQNTSLEGWEQQRVLKFHLDTVEEAGLYSIHLSLRTTNSFPFKTLWLSVKQDLHQPDTLMTDTLSILLTDDYGNQQGRGVSLLQSDLYLKTLFLQKGQSGTITIGHIMRRTILPGIANVGLIVRKDESIISF